MTDTPNPAPASGTDDDQLLGGRYRLVRRLASGGMAEVWEAVDDVLARPVAVKLLHRRLASDDSFVERFRREAVAAARLAHPSIVSIFDTCSDDDTDAIVMELVRGATLRDHLDRHGQLAAGQAVDIVTQVAEALDYAHNADVVHRDVKPGNILLSDDGRVLVADFGIAKAATTGTDLTQTGSMLGTAKYLAPEQVDGEVVDGRADVYALGVVLYELLCGQAPFQADSDLATAVMRLHRDPVAPRQVRAGIPRPLEAVVMKAMARDPRDRYQTAADFRSALLATDLASGDVTNVVRRDSTPSGGIPAVGAPAAANTTATPSFAQTERSWLLPALVVCLVAVALGVAGVLLGSTDVGQELFRRTKEAVGVEDSEASEPLALSDARSFDPEGDDGQENETEADAARDGNTSTVWPTDRYNARRLPPFKPGVGLVVDLGSPGRLERLKVISPTSNWSAQVYVAGQAPADLASWGQPVDQKEGIASGEVTFDLGGKTGGSVLLWIIDVGEDHKAEIGELTVSGEPAQ